MKKLVSVLLICTLLFCAGCFPFAQRTEGGTSEREQELEAKLKEMEDRLNEMEAGQREATPKPEPAEEPTVTPAPLKFDMLDQFGAWDKEYSYSEAEAALPMTKVDNGDIPTLESGRGGLASWDGVSDTYATAFFGFDERGLTRFMYSFVVDTDDADTLLAMIAPAKDAVREKLGDYDKIEHYDTVKNELLGDIGEQELQTGIAESLENKTGDTYAFRWEAGNGKKLMLMVQTPVNADNAYRNFDKPEIQVQVDYPIKADKSEPEKTAEPKAEKTAKPETGNKVVFTGIRCMEELPPGEGQLVITGTSATSDGSGGNNCSVTIANQGDYMFGTGIYYMMYEQNSDYAEEVELAGWVEFDKGEAKTFNFHVPAGMLQAGNCEVFFEYTFW